jgi:hypothetical protein
LASSACIAQGGFSERLRTGLPEMSKPAALHAHADTGDRKVDSALYLAQGKMTIMEGDVENF